MREFKVIYGDKKIDADELNVIIEILLQSECKEDIVEENVMSSRK